MLELEFGGLGGGVEEVDDGVAIPEAAEALGGEADGGVTRGVLVDVVREDLPEVGEAALVPGERALLELPEGAGGGRGDQRSSGGELEVPQRLLLGAGGTVENSTTPIPALQSDP